MAFSSLAQRVAVIGTCLVTLVVVQAWSPATGAAQSLAEARALFERGNRELQASQSQRGSRKRATLERALDAYVESLQIARNRNVLFNTAVTLEGLERDTEAFNYYQEFLQFEDLEEEKRARAQARLQDLTARVGVVAIETRPPGASIRIDRADTPSLGRTPLAVAVEPGQTSNVLITKKGYLAEERPVSLKRGESTQIDLDLEVIEVPLTIHAPGMIVELDGNVIEEGKPRMVLPGEHALRVNMGRIERVIVVEPGEPSIIDLRGAAVGAAPATISVVSPIKIATQLDGVLIARDAQNLTHSTEAGRHRIRFQAAGVEPAEASFSLSPGQKQTLHVTKETLALEETTLGPWPAVFWIGTAVAAAGTAALQLNYWRNLQDNRDDPTNVPIFESAQDARLWGNIALGATAALGITALTLTLLDEHKVKPALRIRVGAKPVEGGALIAAEVRR